MFAPFQGQSDFHILRAWYTGSNTISPPAPCPLHLQKNHILKGDFEKNCLIPMKTLQSLFHRSTELAQNFGLHWVNSIRFVNSVRFSQRCEIGQITSGYIRLHQGASGYTRVLQVTSGCIRLHQAPSVTSDCFRIWGDMWTFNLT